MAEPRTKTGNPKSRIRRISIKRRRQTELQDLIKRDRENALRDLMHASLFQPRGDDNGPYDLELSIEEDRLVFRTKCSGGIELPMLVLSLNPYKKLIQDYFLIVGSYQEAIRDGKPSRIEAIDIGRRGLHNEGAGLLMERLEDKMHMDLDTARRLFTLICVLHAGSASMWRQGPLTP